MKIAHKLPTIFAASLLLSIGGGLFGMYRLNQLNNEYTTIIQVDYGNETTVNRMLVDFKIQVQDWKDTLLRGKNPVALQKYWAGFVKKEADVRQDAARLQASLTPGSDAANLIDQFVGEHVTMGNNYRRGLAAFQAANYDPTAGDDSVAGMDRAPSHTLEDVGTSILASTQAHMNQIMADRRSVLIWSLVIMGLVVIFAGILAWHLIRSITRPLGRAVEVARRVADGDLSTHIVADSTDEFGELLNALKTMNSQLSHLVSEVRQGTRSVALASGEISSGNLDLSRRTESQAGSLEETASALEQITAAIRQNADHAREADTLAQNATLVAEKGGSMVANVVATMGEINDSSRKISDIISVIDSIAFQTNILALNAAVEAARAGEQGRGFAVVASEVRNLAQRSAAAAKEIKTLIDDSVTKVDLGNRQAGDAGSTMGEIVASIQQVTSIISEISTASNDQSRGIEEVNRAVAQIDGNTQQNAALVEQAAAAAKSLQDQASHLEALVDAFVLEGETHRTRAATRPMNTLTAQRMPRPTARTPLLAAE